MPVSGRSYGSAIDPERTLAAPIRPTRSCRSDNPAVIPLMALQGRRGRKGLAPAAQFARGLNAGSGKLAQRAESAASRRCRHPFPSGGPSATGTQQP